MKVNDMIEGKFLKKEDVGKGLLLTVQGVQQHDVAMQGQPEELKWCLEFQENEKPLVLNTTNMHLMVAVTGSDDTDHWIGKQVVLFNDPTVSFAGKIVGGIRIRRPKGQTSVESHVADEDIPF